MEKASAIVLAGGKNARIARDKAFILLPSGKSIVQNILSVLEQIFNEIIIVTNRKEAYRKFNVQVVEDLIRESGPLAGVFSGLCYSRSKHNFVVACDMPFIKPDLIRLLLDERKTYDVVIPEIAGEVEPLFALYSKDCIGVMFEHLQKRNLRMRGVLSELSVKRIQEEDIDRLDPERLSFFNINTGEDLKKAERLKIKTGEAE
jgi:molybdopterin-guanine dinucleotide biosynthesis protein A